MSFRTPLSPTKPSTQGFMPLNNQNSYPNMQDADIPLTTVQSNGSSGARKAGANTLMSEKTFPQEEPSKPGFLGRRKLKKTESKLRRVGSEKEDDENSLTAMGKLYNTIVNFSVVTRYLVYVLPVAAVLAVPIVITATGKRRDATIGGVRQLFFWIWIEIVWLSIWVSKLIAQAVPSVFMFLCGVVSSGTRKYATIIRNLEVPLSLIGWAAVCLATFKVLTALSSNPGPLGWVAIMNKLLTAALISAGILLGEKLVIQLISMNYHKRSFDNRIKDSKHMVHLISHLYDASRTLFPMYCREFEEEDLIINDSVEAMLGNIGGGRGHNRSGSVTPMRLIGNIGRFGDKVTSVFGNIASEIAGKEVFNPTSAHSIVIEALEKKRSSEALAKRLWMSFVVEGRETLLVDDIREVLGPARRDEADEIFSTIDGDGNGDISLDEMILKVVEIGRDRKSIASSMKDIGQAIRVLDQVLITIVLVIIVFVFVAFLNTSFVTFLATASTTLLSLSFVFAVTAQEFLGSCIFLFVKHPYDVGDRVDIDKISLVVDQISLLYTVFKRIDCMKMVQVPNIVLNSMWVDNVTRSRAMKEQLEVFISFDTSIEDIELLRKEMEVFVRDPENNRDFHPDIVLECTGIGNMDKLQLKVEIRHKSNWSNETVRAARRSKFMCALVLALRKVPIYAPGGGNTPLGDPGNPSYTVAVSDTMAQAGRDKAAKTKEGKRLVPSKPKDSDSSGKSSGVETGEEKAADALNARRPADDAGRDESGDKGMISTAPNANSRDTSLDRVRSNDISSLKSDLLKRESTRGRRRPGEAVPPQPNSTQPGFSVTAASPRRLAGFDEEAGIESRFNSNSNSGNYFPGAGGPGPSASASSQAPSYRMFPSASRSQTGGLQPLGSSPPNFNQPMGMSPAGRSRGMSLGQNQQKNQNSGRF